MFRTKSRFKSKWKVIYTNIFPLKLNSSESKLRKLTYAFNRSSTILLCHVGYNFRISSGNKYILKKVTKEMVGFKFGEFVLTTKIGNSIHKTQKNKLKKR